MKSKAFIPLAVLLAALATGCDNEGPAEKAGKQIDEVTEDVRQEGKDLGNKIEDACEEVKEEMGAEDKDC